MDYVPQCTPDRRPLLMWLLVAIGALSFLSLIVVAPLGFASGRHVLAATIYQAFSHICHQIPDRSFLIMGYPLAVCARCSGIYAGFVAGAFAYPAIKSLRQVNAPDRKWLILGAFPLGLDFGLDLLGIWQNTQMSRFLTGLGLGVVAIFFVLPGLIELSMRRKKPAPSQAEAFGSLSTEQLASAPSDYSSPDRRV